MKLIKKQKYWWLAAGLVAMSFIAIKRKNPNKEKEILFIEPNSSQSQICG